MRKSWKAVFVTVGAVTALFASDAIAAADTSSYGTPWDKNCVNSVVTGHSGGQVYAYGTTKCGTGKVAIRPSIALSGNNGQNGLVDKTVSCSFGVYCETPRVYLPEIAGVTYRASNFGTFDGQESPPENAIAHGELVGGTRSSRAGSEAGAGRVRWADFDGDGRADYVIVNPDGSVRVFLDNGGDGHGGWSDIGQVATGLTADGSRVRFADFDGDGRADYILINPDGSVRVFLNKGGDGHGGWQDIGQVAIGLTTDASRVRFADIDGDGRADYNLIDANGAVHTYLNRGGDTGGGWTDYGQIATGMTSDVSRVRLADIDGDGRADYSAINPNGSIATYLNNGGDNHGGWTNYGQIAIGTTTDQNAVVLADITGDGRADYLVTGAGGVVNAYRNDGGDGHGAWTDYGQIAAGA